MNAQMVTATIQLILAPVVMVSACAILLTGLLSRYAAINDRLRAIGQERLDLLRRDSDDHFIDERLREIDYQIPELLRRHKLAQDAVLAVYLAVAVFIGNMFVIAIAAVTQSDGVATLALLIFLAGIAVLLIAILYTVNEVRSSHRAVHYEVRRIAELGKSQ
jgi:uncharacterized protein DUF2721